MSRSGKQAAAAARAIWLAELARAIEDAQHLAWRIGVLEGPNLQALDLYVRLEAARAEIEALRERRIRSAGEIEAPELPRQLRP